MVSDKHILLFVLASLPALVGFLSARLHGPFVLAKLVGVPIVILYHCLLLLELPPHLCVDLLYHLNLLHLALQGLVVLEVILI